MRKPFKASLLKGLLALGPMAYHLPASSETYSDCMDGSGFETWQQSIKGKSSKERERLTALHINRCQKILDNELKAREVAEQTAQAGQKAQFASETTYGNLFKECKRNGHNDIECDKQAKHWTQYYADANAGLAKGEDYPGQAEVEYARSKASYEEHRSDEQSQRAYSSYLAHVPLSVIWGH